MSAIWTSNLKPFLKEAEEAEKFALIAAAYVLVNSVKRALRGGYTSGDFVTGGVINSVTRGQPFRDGQGWAIEVGTDLMYALFWEVGHHSIFSRRYEREERWRPAFMDSRNDMRDAYAQEWARRMNRWRAA